MAVNLGARLRDAVDGPPPGLDAVVGEDPAGFDLPALSARIRRRRRTRAGVQSAVGVAAAGAVAVTGLTAGGRGPDGTAVPVAAPAAELCGRDVSTLPERSVPTLLVPPAATVVTSDGGGVTVSGLTNLGVLAGRRLVTTVVESGFSEDRGPTSDAAIVLTRGGTVVAVGEAAPRGSVGIVSADVAESYADGSSDDVTGAESGGATVYEVSAALAACDPAGGAPADGLYSVQYVVPGAQGLQRAGDTPWTVRLLPEAAPATAPDGYPSDEVPLVAGSVRGYGTVEYGATAGWQLQVAVTGSDGLARAADTLRVSGATVSESDDIVVQVVQDWSGRADGTATEDVGALQRAVDEAMAAMAAARAEAERLAGGGDQEALARARLAADQADLDAMGALQALWEAQAGVPAGQRYAYRFASATSFTARTPSWDIQVTATSPTLLEYRLTAR